ncbi:MAG: ATP-dependent helicase HrpB [bacterium]
MAEALPIEPRLPEIVESLRRSPSLVIVAPPGSGKTTRVPPALLDAGLAGAGEIVVLEPRRVAARAAARRVAVERGVQLGQEVGYRVRLDVRAGPATRITFVTDGVLLRRLQEDPLLQGVAAVVLDELHERSLELDLALAFLREVQRGARPELRVVCMSATLDVAPLVGYLDGCPVIRAQGRQYPVEVQYLPRPDHRPLPLQAAGAVVRLLSAGAGGDAGGHILVFLPGAAEIRRTAEALREPAARLGVPVLPLHGQLPAELQDAALAPSRQRRVILATNVAESSLTIDGVTVVVDTGVVKQLRHDPRHGLDRLALVEISRASADQRAGRAGRTAPGRALRLWTEGDQHGRAAHERPEVVRVDLAAAVLQVRGWGASDPARFDWFQRPPAAALQRADELLRLLGAVGELGLTPLGRTLLALPLHPRTGRMLVAAQRAGVLEEGAWLAALCSEPEVLASARAFGQETQTAAADEVGASDLLLRLERIQAAVQLGGEPAVLRSFGLVPRAVGRVRAVARQLAGLARQIPGEAPRRDPDEETLLGVLLAGFPDRVAVRRRDGGARLLLQGGREAELDRRSVVRDAPLILAHVVDDGAHGRAARVRLASQVTASLLEAALPGCLHDSTSLALDPTSTRVIAEECTLFGSLVIRRREIPVADRTAAGRLLAGAASRRFRQALDFTPEVDRWLGRVRFLAEHVPEIELPVFDDALLGALTAELCEGLISFDELRRCDLLQALQARLSPSQSSALARYAPVHWTVPSGSRVRIDYPDGPPVLAVKLQELFGLQETPRLGRGRAAVLLHLLAPNGRPVQVTRDLASFWTRGYPEVRRELKGRYPRHPWPEDPHQAVPTRRTRSKTRKK